MGIDVGGGRREIGVAVGDLVAVTVSGSLVIVVAITKGDEVIGKEEGDSVGISMVCAGGSSRKSVVIVASTGCS